MNTFNDLNDRMERMRRVADHIANDLPIHHENLLKFEPVLRENMDALAQIKKSGPRNMTTEEQLRFLCVCFALEFIGTSEMLDAVTNMEEAKNLLDQVAASVVAEMTKQGIERIAHE